jgi:lysylphosphatidylglycerol synthetase-like protein (DUF2156 family)
MARRQPLAAQQRTHPAKKPMRYINLYLVGYFILIFGAVLALWQAGILRQLGAAWIAIGLVIALGLGIVLAVSSGKPTITNE